MSEEATLLRFRYYYKIGHELSDGSVVWGKPYSFRAPPSPGQNSLQRIIVFGDMGKVILILIRYFMVPL